MAKAPPSFLLCFDFDGTLVDHAGEPPFHPVLGDMLKEFRRRGAAWVVNTGRSLHQTLQGLGQHGLFLLPDFIIAQECEIYRPGFFSAWRDFGSWNRRARKAHHDFVGKHRKFLSDVRRHAVESGAEFLSGDLGQVGIVGQDDAHLDQICLYIDETAANYPDVGYHRNGRYLRFSHRAFSKGSALSELGRLLGIPPQRIFAAGDNYNDVSMLDVNVAAQIACPSNALDPIKDWVGSQGGFICSRPASEGMIEALEYFFPRT